VSARLEEPRTAPSDGSLLRSFIGSYLRRIGGWISSADVVELLGDAGVSPASARTNLSRLKGKRLLVAAAVDGVPGYRLTDDASSMLARGDRRIYGYRQMTEDDEWMLVVFSVPESRRALRHQLRTQLTWLGCGSVAPGVWIGPGHLATETRQVLDEVGLLSYTTIFCTAQPLVEGDLADVVRQWWDLDALGTRYRHFLGTHLPVAELWRTEPGPDREAFSHHLHAIDDWRAIPYLDPGLPTACLPADWVGTRGVALFAELHQRLDEPSLRHVLTVTGAGENGGTSTRSLAAQVGTAPPSG
jgi:phenylacetic acid degradation operon negative regulatory protein